MNDHATFEWLLLMWVILIVLAIVFDGYVDKEEK